jgi:hypothetical protein
LFIIACGKSQNTLEVLPVQSKLILTFKGNDKSDVESIKVKMIEPNSDIHKKLNNWLAHNKKGWENTSIGSWSLPDISLIGKYFKLLVYKDSVVLGFADHTGTMKEFTKKVDESEFGFLKEWQQE